MGNAVGARQLRDDVGEAVPRACDASRAPMVLRFMPVSLGLLTSDAAGCCWSDRTRAKHAQVHALLEAGCGRRSIARQLGMRLRFVRRFARIASELGELGLKAPGAVGASGRSTHSAAVANATRWPAWPPRIASIVPIVESFAAWTRVALPWDSWAAASRWKQATGYSVWAQARGRGQPAALLLVVAAVDDGEQPVVGTRLTLSTSTGACGESVVPVPARWPRAALPPGTSPRTTVAAAARSASVGVRRRSRQRASRWSRLGWS